MLADCKDASQKLLAGGLLVAAALQKHLGLQERAVPGEFLAVPPFSPLPALLDSVSLLLLSHLSLATPSQLPDILDTQFLLRTLHR